MGSLVAELVARFSRAVALSDNLQATSTHWLFSECQSQGRRNSSIDSNTEPSLST